MDHLMEFSQRSSYISQDFFPPLTLDENSSYVVGLYSLSTYNSIPNIIEGTNNLIYFESKKTNGNGAAPAAQKASSPPAGGKSQVKTDDKDKGKDKDKDKDKDKIKIEIPTGCYEIPQIEKSVTQLLQAKEHDDDITFSLLVVESTMKVQLKCSHTVHFPKDKSLKNILGFTKDTYKGGVTHISERIPQIFGVNIINVECNIVDGSYRNGQRSHTLYSFALDVPPGYKLLQRPHQILFLPVRSHDISNITLRLTDQKGRLVQFKNEEVTIHIVVRELK